MEMKDKLKMLALKHGEEMVKDLIKEVIRPEAERYIKESPNKIDDIVLPFIGQLEGALLSLADEIHKEEEPKV